MQEEWRVYWFRAKIWKHKYPTPCDISTWLRIRIFFTNMSLSLCTHRDGRLNKPRKFTLRDQERATSEAYTAMQGLFTQSDNEMSSVLSGLQTLRDEKASKGDMSSCMYVQNICTVSYQYVY